jgi:DNA-directed RNA polymerase
MTQNGHTRFWRPPSASDIEAQKHWELDGIERGVRRVRAEIEGQRVGDSILGSTLVQHIVPALIDQITAAQKEAELGLIQGAGRPSPWWYLLLMLPADTLAVITIKRVLSATPRDFTFNRPLTGLASDINRTVLDQLDYEDWRQEDKDTVDRFFNNYELTPRNLKRLRERLSRKREQRWEQDVGIQFGVVLLTLLCQAKPEWFSIEQARLRGGRWEYQLVITDEGRDVLFTLSEQCELSQPMLLPMICQPADWRIAA